MADAKNNNWLNGNEGNGAGANTDLSHSGGGFFEIHIKGQLDSRWSEWLEGLEVKYLENGEMILFGPVVDQAALMGILNKLSYLNLSLRSVSEIKKKE